MDAGFPFRRIDSRRSGPAPEGCVPSFGMWRSRKNHMPRGVSGKPSDKIPQRGILRDKNACATVRMYRLRGSKATGCISCLNNCQGLFERNVELTWIAVSNSLGVVHRRQRPCAKLSDNVVPFGASGRREAFGRTPPVSGGRDARLAGRVNIGERVVNVVSIDRRNETDV